MATPAVPGAINITDLTGNEVVPLQSGAGSTQTTTQDIANLAGGGGGSSITLTAGTNLAAGTAVAINSSGHAVQTWGAAPNFAGEAVLLPPPNNVYQIGAPFVLPLGSGNYVVVQSRTLGVTGPLVGAVPVSVSGSTVTPGTINSDASFQTVVSMATLSDTSFLYVWYDADNTFFVTAGSISGGVISLGGAVPIGDGSSIGGDNVIAVLTSTSFVLTYLASGQGTFVVGTLSGTAVTLHTPGTGTLPSDLQNLYVVSLSSTLVALIYSDPGSSNDIFAAAGSISGTTLTEHTPASVSSVAPQQNVLVVAPVDATRFCMAWLETVSGATAFEAFAVVASVSGATTSFGSVALVGTVGANAPRIAVLSSSKLAFYPGQTEPSFASLSGDTLTVTLGGSIPIPVGYISNNQYVGFYLWEPLVVLDGTHLIWEDGLWNVYQEDVSGNISPPVRHEGLAGYAFAPFSSTAALAVVVGWDGTVTGRVIELERTNPSASIGFVDTAVTNGNPATVNVSGITGGFTGLTAGTQYYISGDGTITTSFTGYKAGVAVSSTEILIAA